MLNCIVTSRLVSSNLSTVGPIVTAGNTQLPIIASGGEGGVQGAALVRAGAGGRGWLWGRLAGKWGG